MHRSRPATEAEVVLAFLRGELESLRFGQAVRAALEAEGGVSLVASPDITSEGENRARAAALAEARGWGSDSGLFSGFPADLTWRHGVLDRDELDSVRYIDYSYWVGLSGGSRRPRDVLATLGSGDLPSWLERVGTAWCFEFAEVMRTQGALGDLIILGTPDLDQLVVLEGHARLTALFLGGLDRQIDVAAYIGTSPDVHMWALF